MSIFCSRNGYSYRGESVHFAYVTSLRIQGKQTHILRKLKQLFTKTERRGRVFNIPAFYLGDSNFKS